MNDSEETTIETSQPPYGSRKWYDNFLNLLERIQIDKVDPKFLQTNEVTSTGNEYKVIIGLKFLGLIDEKGNATDKMNSLRVIGDEFTKNLEKIIRDAYSVLFSKIVDLEKAISNDVINCFRRNYDMAPTTAKEASKIFVLLAQRAKIRLSESITKELGVTQIRKAKTKGKEPKREKPKGKLRDIGEEGNYVLVPEGMIPLRYGNKFVLFLPKGDRNLRKKVAKIAKQWIDTYVEEEELETEKE